eukprot:CAMPEP_0194273934 /NCGR_PEP_ID=MMETSP0169-20130528/7161_1 /TAXON_ID=218684 /ORGANISM="Corethron pennatum, Strain L29A3" /LENGTH=164 /DNA_ID=CAMNT_0039017019 /DNA_START=202 /DNA_END=696 /DNA_ORIENTATION=+
MDAPCENPASTKFASVRLVSESTSCNASDTSLQHVSRTSPKKLERDLAASNRLQSYPSTAGLERLSVPLESNTVGSNFHTADNARIPENASSSNIITCVSGFCSNHPLPKPATLFADPPTPGNKATIDFGSDVPSLSALLSIDAPAYFSSSDRCNEVREAVASC